MITSIICKIIINMKILSTLCTGQNVLINRINASADKKIKLLGLGVSVNTKISILKNRNGDMVIAIGNARISLGRGLASLIEVGEA